MRSLAGLYVGLGAVGLLLGPGTARAAPGSQAAASGPVSITLYVPAGAEVWFDGTKTVQTGSVRHFVSPSLPEGRDYAYQLRVRWQDGGRPVDRTRRLEVRAGDRITLGYAGMSAAPVAYAAPDVQPAARVTQSYYTPDEVAPVRRWAGYPSYAYPAPAYPDAYSPSEFGRSSRGSSPVLPLSAEGSGDAFIRLQIPPEPH
jgi:uncharacterized protein (TIGR03000 family)